MHSIAMLPFFKLAYFLLNVNEKNRDIFIKTSQYVYKR